MGWLDLPNWVLRLMFVIVVAAGVAAIVKGVTVLF